MFIFTLAEHRSSGPKDSPSRTHDRTRRFSTAAAIFGNRSVKSVPWRVSRRERSPSRQASMRKPSCLIS